jgi:hypothetical protein
MLLSEYFSIKRVWNPAQVLFKLLQQSVRPSVRIIELETPEQISTDLRIYDL